MRFITLRARIRRPILRLPAFLLFGLGATATFAESESFGDYTVHYTAVHSTFIDPGIAEQYDIVRGRRNAFVNIAVLRNNEDGSTSPVTAGISGGKRNLLTRVEEIEFRQVREGEAIYYIGQFQFTSAQPLRLSIEVQPELQGPVYGIEWETTLYSTE